MYSTNLLVKWTLLGAAMVLGGPSQASWPTAKSQALSELTPKTLESAIDRYAPILVLHFWEKYKPTRVESFLKVTEPFLYKDRDTGKTLRGLRLKGSETEKDAARAGDPEHAETYVNVKVGTATTDIQYWFLYAYNGPGMAYIEEENIITKQWNAIDKGSSSKHLAAGDHELKGMGAHEGDWEHLTVTIDNRSGKLTNEGIYTAASDSGQKHELPGGAHSRVQVYASRNGHGTYLKPGRAFSVQERIGPFGFNLLHDTGVPGGKAIDFRGRCVLIGLQGAPALATALSFKEPKFIELYPGRWGRYELARSPLAVVPGLGYLVKKILEKAGLWDEMTLEAGPEPPWSKGSWTGAE